MAARIVEAVVIRDADAGIELRICANDGGPGVSIEIEDLTDPENNRLLELDASTAKELQLGVLRALKASGAKE